MPTILIVDDDQQIQKLLQRILENEGYNAICASNGVEALKSFKEKRPDLVITDIVMPEKEGIETIMELMKIDPAAKIIAMSGGGKLNAGTYLRMAEKLGAADVLEKPIDKKTMLAKVRALLCASSECS